MLDLEAVAGFLCNTGAADAEAHRLGFSMADSGKTTLDEAARLEAALERIARSRTAASLPALPRTGPVGQQDNRAELAARLDTLIADLRTVLGRDSAD